MRLPSVLRTLTVFHSVPTGPLEGCNHRRRIKTEEMAKVVASVWGKDFIQFLATLAVLPRMILNNMMNCTWMILMNRTNSSNSSKSS